MRTLILSDLHLGATNARAHDVCRFLDSHEAGRADRIILNGDIVDHLNVRRYQSDDWRVLDRLERLQRQRRLVLVRGNHDVPRRSDPPNTPQTLLADLLKTPFHEEYVLQIGSRRLLVQHGDGFDRTLNMTTIGDFAEGVYRQIQRLHRPTSCLLKRYSKTFLGVDRSVRRAALQATREREFDGIILGHTHFSAFESGPDLWYLNTGSWVDETCTYLLIDGSHSELKTWPLAAPRPVATLWESPAEEPQLLPICA